MQIYKFHTQKIKSQTTIIDQNFKNHNIIWLQGVLGISESL